MSSPPRWLSNADGLSEHAAVIWRHLAPGRYKAGFLKAENAETLRQVCRLMALVEAADRSISTHGATVETRSGTLRPNPAAKVLIDAQNAANRLLPEFGLGVDGFGLG